MFAGSEDYQQFPTMVFLWLGIAYLVAGILGASVFRNPPEGYTVPGAAAQASAPKAADSTADTERTRTAPAAPATRNAAGHDFTPQEALRTPQ